MFFLTFLSIEDNMLIAESQVQYLAVQSNSQSENELLLIGFQGPVQLIRSGYVML